MLPSRENTQAALAAIPLELERLVASVQAGLAESHNGNRVDAARYVAGSRLNNAVANSGACRVVGWSVRAVGGVVALTLRDGRDASADPVGVVDLAAGASETVWLGSNGISVGEALYVQRTGAGTVEGSIYLGAVD